MQTPRVSPQAIHKALATAIRDIVAEPVEQIRALEALRLDALLAALWPRAIGGDLQAVDRCLAIMARRSRLLGLDLQPAGSVLRFRDGMEEVNQSVLRVEILNNPEHERVRWLEEERERLLEGREVDDDPPRRVN